MSAIGMLQDFTNTVRKAPMPDQIGYMAVAGLFTAAGAVSAALLALGGGRTVRAIAGEEAGAVTLIAILFFQVCVVRSIVSKIN